MKAFTADKIFTGKEWLSGYSVLVLNDEIADVVATASLPGSVENQSWKDACIAPAFIDLQIYGAAERLLAVYPDEKTLQALAAYCFSSGTAYCLPTLATNEIKVFLQAIDAVKTYWQHGGKGVLGLHLEGPWISKEKRGAHVESLIHSPAVDEVRSLLEYGKGVIKMITLAPEICSPEIIELILSYNIIISAGHSNAGYQQAIKSFEQGVTLVTHLYNAMSGLHHREAGLTGAAFDHSSVMASIIADGYHVAWPAIRIAKKIMGERLFAITDAVTTTAQGYYRHYPAGEKFEAAGILSGSSLTMSKALKNLVKHAGIQWEEAIRMCTVYPAAALKQKNIGCIEKGCKANFVVMKNELDVLELLRFAAE
ncbi:MAG: N-acetylglucosamine-6-phosphate deacetylase [Chitinophagaceae bacterium]